MGHNLKASVPIASHDRRLPMVEGGTIENMKISALEFISQVSRGDYISAMAKFDDNMRRTFTPEKLQALVQQLNVPGRPYGQTGWCQHL